MHDKAMLVKLHEILGPYYAHTDILEQLVYNLRQTLNHTEGGSDCRICLEDVLELHFMDKEKMLT